MAHLSNTKILRARVVMLGLSAALLAGAATGCAKNKAQPVNPEAQARAQQEAQQREQARREAQARAAELARQREMTKQQAIALHKQNEQLMAHAGEAEAKAKQLRMAAMPIDRDGQTNILAGKAVCETGDCDRGCQIVLRGQEKMAKAAEMRAEADRLEMQAGEMRAEAQGLLSEARELIATMPRD